MDQKKKEKKVTAVTNILPTHREEPEEARKPSFADSINIKNLQPVAMPITAQLPPIQVQPPPVAVVNAEPETNGEPEVSPPTAAPTTQVTKHHEKHEQPHQPQHDSKCY